MPAPAHYASAFFELFVSPNSFTFSRVSRLQQILSTKESEVAALLPQLDQLKKQAFARTDFRRFRQALDHGPGALGLVAEVKKASPSAGIIANEFDPVAIARAYEKAGAHAVSVLTDMTYFQGHLDFLSAIREEIWLPLLRKDFTIHPVQIYEAAAHGADAILLIVAALTDAQLRTLLSVAADCQLDAVVEVHTLAELDRALDTDADIIGINNRDLGTFSVDLATTESLAEQIPNDVLVISESGLKTGADAQRVFDAGANAILVGESLMRTPDVGSAVRDFLTVVPRVLPAED